MLSCRINSPTLNFKILLMRETRLMDSKFGQPYDSRISSYCSQISKYSLVSWFIHRGGLIINHYIVIIEIFVRIILGWIRVKSDVFSFTDELTLSQRWNRIIQFLFSQIGSHYYWQNSSHYSQITHYSQISSRLS